MCKVHTTAGGTVTLIEKCSGAVEFEAVATEHRWVVHISGGSVGRGDLTPDREAVGHLGSPFGRADQMTTGPKVWRMPLNADRNRWACPGEAKRFITRSRTLVG